jgi:hypothetical protein
MLEEQGVLTELGSDRPIVLRARRLHDGVPAAAPSGAQEVVTLHGSRPARELADLLDTRLVRAELTRLRNARASR